MNDGTLRHLRADMERQRISANPERRLYLSGMHKKRTPRRTLLKFAVSAALFLSEIALAAGAGCLVACWAIPAAYKFRGYDAIGGEWLLILFVSAITYITFHNWLFKQLEKPQKKEDLS